MTQGLFHGLTYHVRTAFSGTRHDTRVSFLTQSVEMWRRWTLSHRKDTFNGQIHLTKWTSVVRYTRWDNLKVLRSTGGAISWLVVVDTTSFFTTRGTGYFFYGVSSYYKTVVLWLSLLLLESPYNKNSPPPRPKLRIKVRNNRHTGTRSINWLERLGLKRLDILPLLLSWMK